VYTGGVSAQTKLEAAQEVEPGSESVGAAPRPGNTQIGHTLTHTLTHSHREDASLQRLVSRLRVRRMMMKSRPLYVSLGMAVMSALVITATPTWATTGTHTHTRSKFGFPNTQPDLKSSP